MGARDLRDMPAFKVWFGDSKVVDEKGAPLVVYHATTADFSVFGQNQRGVHFVSPSRGWVSRFCVDEEGSVADGANVMPVFVKAINPFDFQNKKHVDRLAVAASLGSVAISQIKKGSWVRLEDRTTLEAIRRLGFDGLYVVEDGLKNLAVFSPEQIKSAIGNRGTYDPQSPDIRFSQWHRSLSDLRQAWKARGIENFISERGGRIHLSQIIVPKAQRGLGVGTFAMRELLDYADRTGQQVTLSPSSDFGGSKARLRRFYKRLGFVENRGRNKDFTIMESMHRPPQGPFMATAQAVNEGALQDLLNQPGQARVIGAEQGELPREGIGRLDSPHGSVRYVYVREGQPVAALQLMTRDGVNALAANAYTAPEARRQGVASELMARARADFAEITMSEDISPDGAAWLNSLEGGDRPQEAPRAR